MKPEDRIVAYLFSQKSKLQYSTLEFVVKDVKLSVFYGMSPISDEEIRKIVSRWAMVNAIGLLMRPDAPVPATPQQPGPPLTASDAPIIDAVKKAMSTITDGVKIGRENAHIHIGVTGLTGNLKKGDQSAALGLSWTGTLKLDAKSGPFHFAGNLSKDKWEIVLSFPQDTYIPDLASLGKVFTEGERAMGKVADATRAFNNLNDATKVAAMMKPHATAVQDAVDAVSGLANAEKKGGPSFGLKFGSPEPMPGEDKMPKGIQGSVVFTYVF